MSKSQNDERADWAKGAIDAFQEIVGTDDEDAMSDLLADLMHLSDRQDEGPGFDVDLQRARNHYDSEIWEEGQDNA